MSGSALRLKMKNSVFKPLRNWFPLFLFTEANLTLPLLRIGDSWRYCYTFLKLGLKACSSFTKVKRMLAFAAYQHPQIATHCPPTNCFSNIALVLRVFIFVAFVLKVKRHLCSCFYWIQNSKVWNEETYCWKSKLSILCPWITEGLNGTEEHGILQFVSYNESLSFIWDLEILKNFKTCNLISSKHFFCHNMQIWSSSPSTLRASLIIRSQFSISQSLRCSLTDPQLSLDLSPQPLTLACPVFV